MTAPASPAVVVGVDGSDTALGAARWAAALAARHSLPLTLLHVVPRLDWHFTQPAAHPDAHDEVPGFEGDRFEGEHGILADAETAIRSAQPDLQISTAAVKGAVAPVLGDASQSARLLVVGAGAADHRTVGGHAVRVVHRSQCPVVVWRPPLAKRTGKPLPVVVGVDESEASNRALTEAFGIARGFRAGLMVAHMWEIAAAVGMGDLGGQGNMDWPLLEALESRQRHQMDALVAPLAEEYPNAHVTKVFRDASPAKGLADLSREAQLVVVGSHGRGRFADAVLGSVGQNLIHHAECPVLIVR